MIGAVTARDPEGSVFLGTKAGEGRTAKPLRIDQSLIYERRYSDCSGVRGGG